MALDGVVLAFEPPGFSPEEVDLVEKYIASLLEQGRSRPEVRAELLETCIATMEDPETLKSWRFNHTPETTVAMVARLIDVILARPDPNTSPDPCP